MINRGIYIIIIGIIFTGKLKVQWGCLSWFKVTFFPPIGSNFGASTERKNPFFAPLRPKGHMCLRAENFYIMKTNFYVGTLSPHPWCFNNGIDY